MERYAEYKDSGTELVPTIPASWEVKPLKYAAVCNLRVLPEDTDEEAEINYIDIGSVEYGKGIGNVQELVFSKAPSRARRIVRTGDTIISTVRTYLKAVAYIDEQYDNFICSTGFAVFTPKAEMDSKFFSYALLDYGFISDVERNSVGVSYPAITSSVLATLKAIFPPVGEQTVIATYLDRRTTEIDELLTDLHAQSEMLDTYKRELIADVVTHGLDKTVQRKNSGAEWIGEIPAHWSVVPLRAVAKDNTVKNTGMRCEYLLSLSYGKIIPKDIDTNFGLLPESFEGYQIVQPGYTVLRLTDLQNDKRSLRTGYVTETGIITSAYTGLIPSDDVDSKYFSYLLHAYDLKKIYYGLGGGVRQSLKYSDLKTLPVLIPPKSEQAAIVAYIDKKTVQVEGLIADIGAQIEKLKQYRQIVIHDAVTGKIKVGGAGNGD